MESSLFWRVNDLEETGVNGMKKRIPYGLLMILLLLSIIFCVGAEEENQNLLEVALYFRYANTGFLGLERAYIDLSREETVATLIVERLIEGPEASYSRLAGLFPRGTRLISAQGDGRIVYVTLNGAFLGRPDGAPSDWESREDWKQEAALRRRLAFQSIVLALTEGARFQRVQLYIAEDDDAIPQRVAMTWFNPDEPDLDLRLAACGRDETLLLTPRASLRAVLEGWRTRDWDAIWPFLRQNDEDAPASSGAFRREMEEKDTRLLTYEISEGCVSLDGDTATLVLNAKTRGTAGGDADITRETIALRREDDNWVVEMNALLTLMVRD